MLGKRRSLSLHYFTLSSIRQRNMYSLCQTSVFVPNVVHRVTINKGGKCYNTGTALLHLLCTLKIRILLLLFFYFFIVVVWFFFVWGGGIVITFFFCVGLFSFFFFFRLLEEWVFKSIYLHNDNYFSPFLGRYWLPGVYVSVCLCVCLSVSFYIDYLKKFLTDFDKTWQDDV